MPVPFEAKALRNVSTWPWNVSYGQIGTKATPLLTKMEAAPLPPALAGPIRAQEREERRQARRGQLPAQPALQDQQPEGGAQGQAGSGDQAASDPPTSSSSSTAGGLKDMDDDNVLQELVEAAQEDSRVPEGVETSPKRSGGEPLSEDESPSKAARVEPRKVPRRD